jgi:hypothetical protein
MNRDTITRREMLRMTGGLLAGPVLAPVLAGPVLVTPVLSGCGAPRAPERYREFHGRHQVRASTVQEALAWRLDLTNPADPA